MHCSRRRRAPRVVVTDDAAAARAGSAPSGSPGTTPSSSSSAVVIDGNYYNDDDDDGLGGRTTDEVGEREGEEEDRNLLLTWLSQEGYRINSPSVARATEVDCEEMGKPSGQGLDEDGVVGEQDCGGIRGRGRGGGRNDGHTTHMPISRCAGEGGEVSAICLLPKQQSAAAPRMEEGRRPNDNEPPRRGWRRGRMEEDSTPKQQPAAAPRATKSSRAVEAGPSSR